MTKEPSVETKIEEVFAKYHATNPYVVSGVKYVVNEALLTQQAQMREGIKGLLKAPCKFYEDMGYHSKNCCQNQHIYNQALEDVLSIIQGKK